MNEDILKGKWKEIKGEIKQKWGKLTDDDLAQVEGKEEELVDFCRKGMDTPRKKPQRNTRGSSAAMRSPLPVRKLNEVGDWRYTWIRLPHKHGSLQALWSLH